MSDESSARVETCNSDGADVQVAYAFANVLYKLAINDRMSISVVTTYLLIFGAFFSLSLALIFERKNIPKLTWRVLLMSFFCGLFGGSLAQKLYFIGLAWVSATFATSIYNLVPVPPLSSPFEKLNLQTAAGRVKVLGTIIGISGSMVLTFFKGPEINIWNFHINLWNKNQNGYIGTSHADCAREWLDILMVFVQIAFAAVNVMYKLAINDGMSMRVASAYRLAFASAFTVPVALVFDRGSLFSNLYLEAMALTSATFMLAMVNLIPGITFIFAISFGFEKLNLQAAEGRAKVIGTIIGISGAMLMTFFKGVEINIWSSNKINLLHPHLNQNGHVASHHTEFRNKLLGIPCAIAKMNAEYPSPHSSAALMSIMGAIQANIFTLCVERDWSQWKLGFNIRLLTVAYSGMVASGVVVVIIAWCIKKRGPLFVSVFNPLQLLLVDIAAYLMLEEKLYLGSVLGAVIIVCGLYTVLWGTAQELKKKSQLVPLGNTRGESENDRVGERYTSLLTLWIAIASSFTLAPAFRYCLCLRTEIWRIYTKLKPQTLYAVVNIMLKIVADDGMSLSVLVAYRFFFASAFIVPLALIFERGSLLQGFYVKSLALTTAVYVTAMLNLIPAVTYILSVTLRLEKSNLGTAGGMTKLLGTLTGIGGAMILTFYKGRRLCLWSTNIALLHREPSSHDAPIGSLLLGCILAFAAALSYSVWLIIQTKMSEKFPWHYSIAALTSATASILSVIFALSTERDWSQWKLGWDFRLLTAASAGILASGVCYPLLAWCVRRKGPLFTSAFCPLMLVIVTLSETLVLDECLSVGSLTGSVLIVGGLYMLLWGKSKEKRMEHSDIVSSKGTLQCEAIHNTDPSS
ncbi:WAT1-related protein [Glycine soja]